MALFNLPSATDPNGGSGISLASSTSAPEFNLNPVGFNPNAPSWGTQAVQNALWQMGPGLVGVRPPNDLARWQNENPGSSFLTGMAGMAVPYLGWAKATAGTGRLAKGVQGMMEKAAPMANMASAPIKTGAVREIVRFAPFEGARVATSPVLGPMFEESLGGEYTGAWDVAKSAGSDLVLGGALGGIFGGLGAYGRKLVKKRGIKTGADLNAPLQVQLRQMNKAFDDGLVDGETLDRFRSAKNRIKREIVDESPQEDKFFRDEKALEKYNPLFKRRSSKVRVGKLTNKSLYQSERIANVLEGFPEDWQAFAKFPRIIQARKTGDTGKNAKNMEEKKKLLSKLRNGDEGTRWEWVPGENTFIVARKLTDTDHLVFKTDKPDMFLPEQAMWKKAMEKDSVATFGRAETRIPEGETGSTLFDFARKMQKDLPFIDWRGLKSKEGAVSSTAKEILAKTGFTPYEGSGEAVRRAGLFVRRYLAPAQLQTTDNPIANKIRMVTKETLEQGEQLAQRGVLGAPERATSGQLKSAFFGPKWADNGSIASRARELSKSTDEWDSVIKTIQSGQGIRYGVGKYGLSERGVQLLKAIEAEDVKLSESVIAAQRAAGIAPEKFFRPKEGHFMLSRTWQGTWRVPVYNSKGNLIYIAGGNTKSQAESIATEVMKDKPWRAGTTLTSTEMQDIELLRRLIDKDLDFKEAMRRQQQTIQAKSSAGKPGTFKKREDIGGYKVEYDGDDFIRSMIQHARRYRKYEAEVSTRAMFKDEMKQLKWDDPEAYVTLNERLDKMYNLEGNITKAINGAFDTVLSGALGNNSASRIVGAANKVLYRYALGFANVGYAVATMGTFIQTAFPMMQLVNTLALNAPERLAKYTTYQPVFSQNGARMLGSIDTMKIAGQGFKELGNPDAALAKNLYKAAEEGVTDPRFLDEWVGQTSVNKQRFKGVLEGKEPFSRMLAAIADTMPAITERGARGHSFAMGHIFYRDIMGVTDPDILYRLAKDFTEKTQYMYSAGDRPQLFNGPLGGMFGLFKNWMAHYTGWMFSYMGEAAKYGNWKPMLWMMGGTSSLGGVGALPFIGLADDVSQAFNNEGLLLTLYEMQGGADPDNANLADAVYYGLPSLFGASIQGTVSAPLANPGEDIIRMFSFAHMNQAKKIGNAFGATVDAMEAEGQYFLRDQEARRALLNASAPKTLVRMAQAMEGPDLRSMTTGNTMVTGMSPIQRLMWGASLNPKETEAQFAIGRELWRDQNKLRERVGYYGQQMANMYEARDMQQVQRLMMRATAEGIPLDSIQRSAQARMKRSDSGLIEAQFDGAVQARMRELGIL